jgi:Uma2 family endonuclease
MASTCAIFDDLEIIVPDEARPHAGFRAWAKSDACPERARVTFFQGEILVDMTKKVILVPRQGVSGQYLELLGSPDLLVEIVSRSSIRKDKVLLREAYHRARVPEYWLIDARSEEIDFKLLWWRRSGYVAMTPRAGWLRSRILRHEFKLERQRHRLDLWRYTLHARPIV